MVRFDPDRAGRSLAFAIRSDDRAVVLAFAKGLVAGLAVPSVPVVKVAADSKARELLRRIVARARALAVGKVAAVFVPATELPALYFAVYGERMSVAVAGRRLGHLVRSARLQTVRHVVGRQEGRQMRGWLVRIRGKA
ncbi:MAG: hypothetical protein AMXMBFR7_25590 [Planctomycetota bacterium]